MQKQQDMDAHDYGEKQDYLTIHLALAYEEVVSMTRTCILQNVSSKPYCRAKRRPVSIKAKYNGNNI